jgi:hypothetical protein
MTEESAPLGGMKMGRWVFLAVLVVACLVAYFVLAPRVPPVVVPFVSSAAP